jgi:hypothetical protein
MSDTVPQHDPVAEDMDIMTHQEAAARFHDEIERLRADAAELSDGSEELATVQARIRDLEAAAARVSRRSSPL